MKPQNAQKSSAAKTQELDPTTGFPPLSPTDALAKKLGYVEDASKAKRALPSSSAPAPSQNCRNCQLYVLIGEDPNAQRGLCLLFPKFTVASQGWCQSWIKKHD